MLNNLGENKKKSSYTIFSHYLFGTHNTTSLKQQLLTFWYVSFKSFIINNIWSSEIAQKINFLKSCFLYFTLHYNFSPRNICLEYFTHCLFFFFCYCKQQWDEHLCVQSLSHICSSSRRYNSRIAIAEAKGSKPFKILNSYLGFVSRHTLEKNGV